MVDRELNSENFKLRQAEGEILRRNVEVLGELFRTLRKDFVPLRLAAEAVGFLDLLGAFAGYARAAKAVRPEMLDTGPLAIKAGRHPTLERLLLDAGSDFEAVDYFLGDDCHFQLVTGHNGGGKSTYLQTLAQLVILAQIGCFIPAQSAQLRVCSSIFTRMGTSDSIEASASSFLVEMKEASHILKSLAKDSLVLIDELGRGTAHADGLAICWAFAEKLLQSQVRCLFATHYFELCHLQGSHSGLRNMHLEQVEGELRRYKVQHISSLKTLELKGASRYGLRAALANGIPKSLVARAEELAVLVDRALSIKTQSLQQQLKALSLKCSDMDKEMLKEVFVELRKPYLKPCELTDGEKE